jgi:hypothetical protein
VRAEPDAVEPLVQVLVRPAGEARVDRAVERDELLRDAARDVIVTTITTVGCSSSTSTWRTVAVSSGGAETSASSASPGSASRSSTGARLDLAAHRRQVEREARGRGSCRSSSLVA